MEIKESKACINPIGNRNLQVMGVCAPTGAGVCGRVSVCPFGSLAPHARHTVICTTCPFCIYHCEQTSVS